MKKVFHLAIIAALAVGCRTLDMYQAMGTLSVSLEPEVNVQVKACDENDTPNYTVSVTSRSDVSGLPYQSAFKDFKPLDLPMGTYTVSAENCTADEAVSGYGRKRLFGTKDVTLSYEKPNQTVNLDCILVNSLISIILDPSGTGVFNDLKVTVQSGTRSVVIKEGDKVSEAWFNPAAISWTISGVSKATGKTVSQEGNRTLDARQNLKITVKVTYSDGMISVGPEIIIDKNISKSDENKNDINPYN